jgi:hypothetical protein
MHAGLNNQIAKVSKNYQFWTIIIVLINPSTTEKSKRPARTDHHMCCV